MKGNKKNKTAYILLIIPAVLCAALVTVLVIRHIATASGRDKDQDVEIARNIESISDAETMSKPLPLQEEEAVRPDMEEAPVTDAETDETAKQDETAKSEEAGEQSLDGDSEAPEETAGEDDGETADETKVTEENEDTASEADDDRSDIPENTAAADVSSYADREEIGLDPSWEFAEFSAIHSGKAVLYRASANRKNVIIGVNAGHGTSGGASVKTYCHPDMSPKVTGGSTASGSIKATAVSGGMSFNDGTPESAVTLKMARIFRDKLLAAGYDVLMIRDSDDVQLDNVARTVICNNVAACHIALHWDGDSSSSDKGCFYISVPDGIKNMYPVSGTWEMDNKLGESLIAGLRESGAAIYNGGSMAIDLTQTSYSKIPSVDIELGNQCADHSDEGLNKLGNGLLLGVQSFFP